MIEAGHGNIKVKNKVSGQRIVFSETAGERNMLMGAADFYLILSKKKE